MRGGRPTSTAPEALVRALFVKSRGTTTLISHQITTPLRLEFCRCEVVRVGRFMSCGLYTAHTL